MKMMALKTDINVAQILFSRRKLRSIIYDLVSNAIKFRSSGRQPEVLIRTHRKDDLIIITVEDNGIGIPCGKQEAIFSKYFRVENDIKGSGIGLYPADRYRSLVKKAMDPSLP